MLRRTWQGIFWRDEKKAAMCGLLSSAVEISAEDATTCKYHDLWQAKLSLLSSFDVGDIFPRACCVIV